jgi:hypothetical protein
VSAWGKSWGAAFGKAWGLISPTQPAITSAVGGGQSIRRSRGKFPDLPKLITPAQQRRSRENSELLFLFKP